MKQKTIVAHLLVIHVAQYTRACIHLIYPCH